MIQWPNIIITFIGSGAVFSNMFLGKKNLQTARKKRIEKMYFRAFTCTVVELFINKFDYSVPSCVAFNDRKSWIASKALWSPIFLLK